MLALGIEPWPVESNLTEEDLVVHSADTWLYRLIVHWLFLKFLFYLILLCFKETKIQQYLKMLSENVSLNEEMVRTSNKNCV